MALPKIQDLTITNSYSGKQPFDITYYFYSESNGDVFIQEYIDSKCVREWYHVAYFGELVGPLCDSVSASAWNALSDGTHTYYLTISDTYGTTTSTVLSFTKGTSSPNELQFGVMQATINNTVLEIGKNDTQYITVQGSKTHALKYTSSSYSMSNIIFKTRKTASTAEAPTWVKCEYNGDTCYISTCYSLWNITYNQALQEEKVCYIDGVLYKMKLMPQSFWSSLSSDIIQQLGTFKCWMFTDRWDATTENIVCVSHNEGSSSFSYPTYHIQTDSNVMFLPVLVRSNDLEMRDHLSFGNFICSGSTGRSIVSYSNEVQTISYANTPNITINSTLESNPIKWKAATDYSSDTSVYYICDNIGFNNISYTQAVNLCNSWHPISVYGRVFKPFIASEWLINSITLKLMHENGSFRFIDGAYIMTSDQPTSSTIQANEVYDLEFKYTGIKGWQVSMAEEREHALNDTASDLYFVPVLVEVQPPTIDIGKKDLGSISSWTDLFYNITSKHDNVTIKEYLNGEQISPTVIDYDVSINSVLTYSISASTFNSLPIGQKNTIKIEVSNAAGSVSEEITFVRSSSSFKLGCWDVVSVSDYTSTIYSTNKNQSIVGSAYKSFILNTAHTSDLFNWIGFTYDGGEYFICDQFGINWISYQETLIKIVNSKNEFVMNGKTYRLIIPTADMLLSIKGLNYSFFDDVEVIHSTLSSSSEYSSLITYNNGGKTVFISSGYSHSISESAANLYYVPVLQLVAVNTLRIKYTGDTDLGISIKEPTVSYQVSGPSNSIIVTEIIDNVQIRRFVATSGSSYTFSIPSSSWLTYNSDGHYMEIRAEDTNGSKDNTAITFGRAVDEVVLVFNPMQTNDRCTYINSMNIGMMGSYADTLKNIQIYASNNAFDEEPTWEKIEETFTETLLSTKFSHFFSNTSKTSDKWGISIKIVAIKEGACRDYFAIYSSGLKYTAGGEIYGA